MIELGKRSEIFGENQLEPLNIYGEPSVFPFLTEGYSLLCGYDQGLGERIFVCESLEDMKELYKAYAGGWALRINWYKGYDVGFIQVIALGPVSDPKPEPSEPRIWKCTWCKGESQEEIPRRELSFTHGGAMIRVCDPCWQKRIEDGSLVVDEAGVGRRMG